MSGLPTPGLRAAEAAIVAAVGGGRTPAWDLDERDIFVDLPGMGRFALRELSDGYRGVIALVADIARRSATLLPTAGANVLSEIQGIVVIDEVDLHLHPEWQWRLLRSLSETFPKIQFVVTTHSPLVLSSVKNHQVRKLSVGNLEGAHLLVHNRDINAILQGVMQTLERPQEGEIWISALLKTIEAGDIAEAQVLLNNLRNAWGDLDPNVVRAETLLNLEKLNVEGD